MTAYQFINFLLNISVIYTTTDLFSLNVCFVFPTEVPGESDSLSFHKLYVDMHVNKTKFERNSSLGYYHMNGIGKTKHTS